MAPRNEDAPTVAAGSRVPTSIITDVVEYTTKVRVTPNGRTVGGKTHLYVQVEFPGTDLRTVLYPVEAVKFLAELAADAKALAPKIARLMKALKAE